MRRALALLLFAACAPKEDYTPQIAVDPGAPQRICYLCVQSLHNTQSRCPEDIADFCLKAVHSDVVPGPLVIYQDDDQRDASAEISDDESARP